MYAAGCLLVRPVRSQHQAAEFALSLLIIPKVTSCKMSPGPSLNLLPAICISPCIHAAPRLLCPARFSPARDHRTCTFVPCLQNWELPTCKLKSRGGFFQ